MAKIENGATSITLEEVLKNRGKKAEYDIVPTPLDGISLKFEKGTERFKLLAKTLGHLATTSKLYYGQKVRIKAMQERLKIPDADIKGMAVVHDGLRGIISKKDKFSLSVFPRHTITWNRDRLQESLGPAYSTVVGEEVNMSVSVPPGHETPESGHLTSEMVQRAMLAGLVTLGFSEEQVLSIAKSEVALSVDEVRLGQMVTDGQVSLPEDTGIVTETWTITTDRLNSPSR